MLLLPLKPKLLFGSLKSCCKNGVYSQWISKCQSSDSELTHMASEGVEKCTGQIRGGLWGTDGCWWGLQMDETDERQIVRNEGGGMMSDKANLNMHQDSV